MVGGHRAHFKSGERQDPSEAVWDGDGERAEHGHARPFSVPLLPFNRIKGSPNIR